LYSIDRDLMSTPDEADLAREKTVEEPWNLFANPTTFQSWEA
jgi:hypothetical protein